jgi:ribosome-binding factor A
VTEKKAPTDESIKILNEFEAKAMNNIIAKGKVEDNIINFKWYITHDPHSFDEDVCKCFFTINGKEYDFDFRLPNNRYTPASEIIEKIRENIISKLGGIFTYDLFKKCERPLIGKYKKC